MERQSGEALTEAPGLRGELLDCTSHGQRHIVGLHSHDDGNRGSSALAALACIASVGLAALKAR